MVVHPDGTIFALEYDKEDWGVESLIGIDPVTGAKKFSVLLEMQAGSGDLDVSEPIIAGDGYAYVPYAFREDPHYDPSYDHLRLLRVSSTGAYDIIPIFDWTTGGEELFGLGVNMITNADQGVLLTWSLPGDEQDVPYMALTNGASSSLVSAPNLPGGREVVPVLQAQDGSFVGTAYVGDDEIPSMVAFDAGGNVRWTVPAYGPKIATADGGVIAQAWEDGTRDFTGAVMTFDQNGNATGQTATRIQSWTGNVYVADGPVESVSFPPIFPDPASFWAETGGNPSANGTAVVQCPCLLQSAVGVPDQSAAIPTSEATRLGRVLAASGAPLKTYLILEGDAGLNLGPGHDHNVGALFHLSAETERDEQNSAGNLASEPKRVSSVEDFAAQLTGNGPITGGVIYFGHGMGVSYADGTWSSALAPGEQAGSSTNITKSNVGVLSNAQLDTNATVTLHACYAGYGVGRYSIAQMIADRLQRRVYAPVGGAFFTVDRSSTASGGNAPKLPSPLSKPVYQIQDGGIPFRAFYPH